MTDSKELQNLIESFNNSYEQMNLVQESLRRLAEGTFDLSERIKDFGSQSNAAKLLPQLAESREQIETVFTAVQQQVQQVEKKVADLAERGQAAVLRVTNVDDVIHELQQGIGKYTASLEACAVVTQQISDFVTANNSLEQNVARTRDTIGELRLDLQELQPDLKKNSDLLHDVAQAQVNVKRHLMQIQTDSEDCKAQIGHLVSEVQRLNSGISDYVAAATPATITLREAAEPLGQLLTQTSAFVREAKQAMGELQTVHQAIESEHNTYQQLTGELAVLRADIRLMADENQLLKAVVEDFRKMQVQSRQQAEELRKELSEDVAQALKMVDHGERRVSEDIAESKKYLHSCVEATVQCRAEIGEMMERHKGICDAISQPTIGNEEQYYTLFRKVVVDVIAEQKKQEGKGFIKGLFRR